MEADFGNADVERLIYTVRKYPEIWDMDNEDHKNRIKRKAAWVEICKVFNEDFEDLRQPEQELMLRKFMRKWKNLKDAFMKSLKINTENGKKEKYRNYLYEKQLAFLLKNTSTNSDSDNELDKYEEMKSIKRSHQSTTSRQTYLPKRHKNLPKQDFQEDHSIPTTNIPIAPEIDEDTSFFNSILPIVRQFDADQKLDFRSEVLNAIKKIRLATTVNQQSTYSTNTNLFCTELNVKEDLDELDEDFT